MTEELFGGQLQTVSLALIVSGLRTAAFFSVSPFVSGRAMPKLCRSNLIISLALIIAPGPFEHFTDTPPEAGLYVMLVVKEMVIGLFLGLLIWFPVRGLEFAGVFIDTQRGATMSEDFNPVFNAQTTPASMFLSQAFSGYFFSTGGFLIVLGILHSSIVIWPVHESIPPLVDDALWIYMTMAGRYFAFAILLATPIVGFMFVADIAIAFLAKKAQELNPLVFGMPVKTSIMLVMLIFYVEVAFPEVMKTLESGLMVFRLLFANE